MERCGWNIKGVESGWTNQRWARSGGALTGFGAGEAERLGGPFWGPRAREDGKRPALLRGCVGPGEKDGDVPGEECGPGGGLRSGSGF